MLNTIHRRFISRVSQVYFNAYSGVAAIVLVVYVISSVFLLLLLLLIMIVVMQTVTKV